MKKTTLMMTFVSAVVLAFGGPAFADTGRTVSGTYEFHAVGHGDVTGVCLNQPSAVPGTGSCVEATPKVPTDLDPTVEDHVAITVKDSTGADVYFSVQQEGGTFGWGCGTVTSHPNGEFPILGTGPGGGEAPPVVVFPWAGPGFNNGPDDLCDPGSSNLGGGNVTFVFHNHVTP